MYRTDPNRIADLLPPGFTLGAEPTVHVNFYMVPVQQEPEYGCVVKVRAEFEAYGAHNLLEAYGLSEAGPATHVNPIGERNRQGIPVALYLHPWELDPDPPRIRLPWAKRFVHYFRLEGFSSRLEVVLRGCQFAPMGEVLGLHPARA